MSQTFIHISGVYSMTILNAKIDTHLDYIIGFEESEAAKKMLPEYESTYHELVNQLRKDREVAYDGPFLNWYQGLVIVDVQGATEHESYTKILSISCLDELNNFIDYVTNDLYRARLPRKIPDISQSSTEKINEFFTSLVNESYLELRISGAYTFINDTDELLGEEEKHSTESESAQEGMISRQFICSLRFAKGHRRLELEPNCYEKLIESMQEMQRDIKNSQNSRYWDVGAVVFEKNFAFATQDAIFFTIDNTEDLQKIYDLLEEHLVKLRRSSPVVIFSEPAVINAPSSNQNVARSENPQEISTINNDSCFSRYFKCLRPRQRV